ncbi:hypothetical protein Tdes44962_MAKER04362 [Teratosphaeria destructans]|uniref:Uncharacterized protein n=1 Tax=Teratosphaeria destructans TaxID=418781 RepID=A0A9W7SMP7_9PEZI|nr:hypothetical protein Tdes44962_MAKER04362 [Teratosphaeria destructans]
MRIFMAAGLGFLALCSFATAHKYKIDFNRYTAGDCQHKIPKTDHLTDGHCKDWKGNSFPAYQYAYHQDMQKDEPWDKSCQLIIYEGPHCSGASFPSDANEGLGICAYSRAKQGIQSVRITCD